MAIQNFLSILGLKISVASCGLLIFMVQHGADQM
jgi:hypothetical protein